MVGRPRRESAVRMVSVRVDEDVYDGLTVLCTETGQTKTFAVQKAIEQYVQRYNEQQQKLNQR